MTWIIVVCCKQKTAYEMRISDWSSDVCSSDLGAGAEMQPGVPHHVAERRDHRTFQVQAGARGERLDAGLRCRVEPDRSDERRVGHERVSTCRSRCTPYH